MAEKKKQKKKPVLLPKISLPNLPKIDLTNRKYGFGLLMVGIGIALILGALATGYEWGTAWVYWVLALGVVAGILNMFHKEGVLFLMLGLSMTFMLNLLSGMVVFPVWATMLFYSVVYLLAPATVVVGLKVVYALVNK